MSGHGRSDASQFNRSKYSTLNGYAEDVLEICRELDLADVIFVGHSVSAIIGMLAAIAEPERFAKLILIGPSPRYIDDGDYTGGFTHEDIEALLAFLDSDHPAWSSTMAPVIMGNPENPELSEELSDSFCRTDPAVARHFARVSFMSDNRADVPKVRNPLARAAMLAGRDRSAIGRALHAPPLARQRAHAPGRDRPLPKPQRPGGDRGRHQGFPARGRGTEDGWRLSAAAAVTKQFGPVAHRPEP
jgi:pimeloyl-ACP methyl ester carboxylesterase